MIRLFETKDMDKIYPIVYKFWSNELDIDNNTKEVLYQMLTEYYYKNTKYSFVLNDVDAFLFGGLKEDRPLLERNYDNSLIKEYISYLDYNNNKVKYYMTNKSLAIGLLASVVPNGGKKLLKHIEIIAKKDGIDSIYLWTDETCNYSYYTHLGYTLVEEYIATMLGKKLKTYIYRLEIR